MKFAKHLSSAVIAAIFSLVAACGDSLSPSEEPETPLPVGVAALTDLTSLAELRPAGHQVLQVSSYDRSGGNNDLGVGLDSFDIIRQAGLEPVELDNSFLYRDGDRYVIFDSLGPGVVYRIWMTAFSALLGRGLAGDIAFEFDDEPTPRLQLTRDGLFSGDVPPFIAPLVGNAAASSGGFYSMVPLPYAHRLRITTSTVPNWVQITYVRLPLDREIESFDPNADVTSAAAALAASGTDPKDIEPTMVSDAMLNVDPGQNQLVWEHTGAGTVLRLELFAPAGTDIPLGLRLQATWDDAPQPQVDAPLDDFFAASLGPGARSLAFGRDGDRFYCYLPMPFKWSARIVVRNDGAQTLSGWRLQVSAIGTVVARRPAYFHASANAVRLEPDGRDFTLLETNGTGHVVAVILTAGCAEAGRCTLPALPGLDGAHLEGDERFAVDGSRYPQIHGTGLEDFFNGGFYFVRGAFALPTHGNPAQAGTSPRRPGRTLRSVYRLLLGDAIPFANHIRLAIEHGPTDDVPAQMSSLVLFYAIPEPTLIETQAIILEPSAPPDRELTSAFRGDDSDLPVTAEGSEAVTTRLRITVAPNNGGVRLRRLADIGAGRQSAEVRVNGVVIGSWYSTDINAILRWAELDFDIPARFTAGLDAIEVELDATASPNSWTSYGYTAFNYVPPG